VGVGAAPAGGVTIHSREASGHRPGGTTAPVRGARWNGRWHHAFVPCLTARQPDEGNWRLGLAAKAGLRPDKRGPETKNADKRSATGRADGGSIHPRRILAQRMRLDTQRASRRSAAPRFRRLRASAGGDFGCVVSREGAGNPSPASKSAVADFDAGELISGRPEISERGRGEVSAPGRVSHPCPQPR
jgi:hypothetical protein